MHFTPYVLDTCISYWPSIHVRSEANEIQSGFQMLIGEYAAAVLSNSVWESHPISGMHHGRNVIAFMAKVDFFGWWPEPDESILRLC
jgi:hypothetical protein